MKNGLELPRQQRAEKDVGESGGGFRGTEKNNCIPTTMIKLKRSSMMLLMDLILGHDAKWERIFVELKEQGFSQGHFDSSLSLELVKRMVDNHLKWSKS